MAARRHCAIGMTAGSGLNPRGRSLGHVSRLRSIVDRTYEVFNARDFDAYRELLDEHVELVMSGITVRGLAAVTDFVAVTARARPSLRIEPQRVFVETDNTLVTEVRMIDTAPPGSAEEGTTVESSACGLYRVADGRIVEWRVYVDPTGEDLASAALMAVTAEQSALRRVAELVARHAPAEQVFDRVTKELSLLMDVDLVRTVRFEPDGTATVLASRGAAEDRLGPGTNVPLPRGTVIDKVFSTGLPASVHGYEHVPGPVGEVLREEGARSGAGGPIVVDGRLWGAMAVGSTTRTLAPGTEDRVAEFAELVSTAISNIESRAKVERLAAEQSALRRVATLVARAPGSEGLFSAVAREVASVLNVPGVIVQRYEPDGTVVTLGDAFHSDLAGAERFLGVGTRMPRDPGSLAAQVFETHRAARIDDFSTLPGTIGDLARAAGLGSGCAGPIVVNGALWGKMCAFSRVGTVLPVGTEHRLHDFIELVATAIANYESRIKVERLAAEQSALRRVATLVAREHSPDDLFATLAEELGVLLGVDAATILRYEVDATATVVAGWSDGTISLPLGDQFPLEGAGIAGKVHRTGLPQRKEVDTDAPGATAAMRELGVRSAAASPIVVEGATWGMLAVLSRKPESLPPDTEARLAEFSRVAGIAVANAKSRSDLAESRARLVRAGDEARRRFERDLHDGAQQRLVSLGMELRAAEADVPSDVGELPGVLSRLATGLTDVLDDLRELSRGLHPAVLSEDGLGPALHSLALRSAVPVDLRVDLDSQRFEEPVEVAAYYVASEALTNTAKHAEASRAEVRVVHRNGWLKLSVSDDGRGGADASSGSGLTGLVDRVEAIGGSIEIDSPPDGGTTVTVKLPARRPSHDRLATTPP
jgi:signal transduction histidine kinase/ketosteroid isomerase-like protein